jgi:hypothetical protein
MTSRVLPVAGILLLSAGCLADAPKMRTVSDSIPGPPTSGVQKAQAMHSPATEAVAVWVAMLGRKIVAANSHLPVKPAFNAIGSPKPEIFHRYQGGAWDVWVTEGLVNQCKDEGQLAAVLCQELGKMANEQIAMNQAALRRMERAPLPYIAVGNDIGCSDGLDKIEMGRYEKDRDRVRQAPPPPPEQLAKTYLQNAGYSVGELNAVAPLLKTADQNDELAQQMTASPAK